MGAKVTGVTGCSWVKLWLNANKRNDSTAEKKALEALQTCKHWKIFENMKEDGAWPSVFRGYVKDLEKNKASMLDVKAQWGTGLGCARNLPDW